MQQEQNVVDMLDEVFVKGATSPKCGKRISSVSSGHGASGVAFGRVSAAPASPSSVVQHCLPCQAGCLALLRSLMHRFRLLACRWLACGSSWRQWPACPS
jgi:hypothetical protein